MESCNTFHNDPTNAGGGFEHNMPRTGTDIENTREER